MSRLVLLPAVDVATGRPYASSRARPAPRRPTAPRCEAALAWQARRRRVDPPGRPRRRVRPRLQPRAARRGRGAPRRQGRAVRRHPRRRLAAPPRSPPAARGSTSAPPRWRTPSGSPRSSPSTATGSRSAWTCAARRCAAAAGPATAATCGRRWPGWTPTAAPATSSPTSPRTARCAGPNVELLREVCAATDRPVVASGGVSSLDDLRALAALVPRGRRGRDRRQGAVRGRVHAARRPWRPCRETSTAHVRESPPAGRGRTPSATPARSWSGGRVPRRRAVRPRSTARCDPRGRPVRPGADRVRSRADGAASRRPRARRTWCAPGCTSPTPATPRRSAARTRSCSTTCARAATMIDGVGVHRRADAGRDRGGRVPSLRRSAA